MIFSWFSPLGAFLKNIPSWAWVAFAAALCVIGVYHKGYNAGRDRCEADYAEAARIAGEKARHADSKAGEAVTSTVNEVERKNDEARKAAAGSDDPLKRGIDGLR